MTIELKKPGVSPPEKIIITDYREVKGQSIWNKIGRCPRGEMHQNNDDHFSLNISDVERRVHCKVCGFAAIFWDEAKAHPKKENLKEDPMVEESRGYHDIAYTYYDIDGKTPLHRTCKMIKPKKFWQECYCPITKKWWNGLTLPDEKAAKEVPYNKKYMGLKLPKGKPVKLVLYNLKRIIDNPDKKVFILEGEKACDYFWDELGLIATTNPMGAGYWKRIFDKSLKDRNVVAIPDNDTAGAVHVIKVGNSLAGICKSYKIIRLLGLKDKEDSDDWINNCKKMGMTGTQMVGSIKEYIGKVEEYVPSKLEEELQIQEQFNSVVFGRIIRDHYSFISTPADQFYIYLPEWKMWFEDGELILRQILRKDYLEDKDWQSHKVSEIVIYIKDIVHKNKIELKKLIPPIPLIPLNNVIIDMSDIVEEMKKAREEGTVNPKKAKPIIRKYSKDHFFLKKLAVNYNEEHKVCPRLDEMFSEYVSKRDLPLLYEIPAYCLWRSYPENKIPTLWGYGKNGKTQYLEAIKHLLGEENTEHWSSEGLSEKFSVATLEGKYANLGSEEKVLGVKNVGILKDLSGGGTLTAQNKFKDPFAFKPWCKIILMTNRLPSSPVTDDAWMRRQLLLNFPNQFIKDGKIPPIKDIMETVKQEEWEGLMYKLINEYLPKLIRNDWTFTNEMSIDELRAYYTQQTQPELTYINLFYDKSLSKYTPCVEFNEECSKWCGEQGKFRSPHEIAHAMTINGFVRREREHPTMEKTRVQCYIGLGRKTDSIPEELSNGHPMIEESKKVFNSTGQQDITEVDDEKYIKPEDNPFIQDE